MPINPLKASQPVGGSLPDLEDLEPLAKKAKAELIIGNSHAV